ncbi:prefoldin subunit 5-like isoform X2 [Uloborus diversus]|uniref:prefoldin subunit 5-like isoform X1 n=1 Tax=Uloborus diversus TaxID=327109 RepID=UPI0024094E28|nr:prefoldin subunit 5-like isoform X1 [Uloborus diversus]XP_054710776.1 prefoldin subunit 5-like isoform X2 [Uloborus diversus]
MAGESKGDNVVTIDVNELPLARLTQIKQDLDSQVEIFGSSLQQLKIAQKKYGDSKEAVEKMQEMKEGMPLLVPLTDSMYVPGQLDDTKKVLIDVGTGYYVEKELPDAIDYFKRKVKFVTTQIEKVQQIMKEKLIAREVVIETMESKIQATLAAQQAAATSAKS